MRPDLPSSLVAQRFLIRARQYRAQAILLADMERFEPNWPKYFLLTHAIELAINAFLVFEPGTRRGGTNLKTTTLWGSMRRPCVAD